MDRRRTAEEARRNVSHLRRVLGAVLPHDGLLVELGSGTGEHAVSLCRVRPGLTWQPTDVDAIARASCEDWIQHARVRNVRPPLELDVAHAPWPIERADALLAVNLLHLIEPTAIETLLDESARLLASGAPLVVHGPFLRGGRPPSPRLAEFDARLRAGGRGRLQPRDSLVDAAEARGLWLVHLNVHDADLDTLVFRRVPSSAGIRPAPTPIARRPWWLRWAE